MSARKPEHYLDQVTQQLDELTNRLLGMFRGNEPSVAQQTRELLRGSGPDGERSIPVTFTTDGHQNIHLAEYLLGPRAAVSAVGNLSRTAYWVLSPPADKVYLVTKFVALIEDNGSFDLQSYGNSPALENGVSLQARFENGKQLISYTNALPVRKNVDWYRFCSVETTNFLIGNNILQATLDFTQTENALRLEGSKNESLVVVLQDDFSGLVSQTFFAMGYIEGTKT
jgi:hypothetical protein